MIIGNACRPECGEDKRGWWGLQWVRVHECRQGRARIQLTQAFICSSYTREVVSSSRASIWNAITETYFHLLL